MYQTVCGLTRDLNIRDKAVNLKVRDAKGVENEMDVAFLLRNRLYVIECKTARMDRPEAPKANDTLYKLKENCSRIGGLGTHGMLASYRALNDRERRLAQALQLKVVAGRDLTRLDELIKCWAR